MTIRLEKGLRMWAYESTFYQFYPLGLLGAPTYAPAVGDTAAEDAERAQHRILKLADWAPYLDELGVGSIILNPVFAATWHGYDTRDFRELDCRLGTNDDLVAVIKQLHAHGVRILLDGVFNHVGRDFWAFRDVRERKWDSPYKDWFNISFDGNTHFNDGFWYEGWEGNQDLVKLNLKNPAVTDYLIDCIRFWRHELGIDGLRLDVAYSLDHDFIRRLRAVADELAAEPAPAVVQDAVEQARAGQGNAAAAEKLLSDRAFFLLGETLHGDYSLIVNDQMLDSCTNYECYKGLYSSFNSMNLFEIAHSLNRQFGPEQWCIYRGKHLLAFADNHDVSRLASILTNKRHLVPAYGLLFGMPGIPCLYYGSEWGIAGEKGRGYEADMKLRPALAAPSADALKAEEQQIARLGVESDPAAPLGALSTAVAHMDLSRLMSEGPNALTALITRLARVRASSRALGYGDYHNVNIQNKQLLFERVADAYGDQPRERVLVAINADEEPHTFYDGTLNCWFEDMLAEGPAGARARELTGSLEVPPMSVMYLREVPAGWVRPGTEEHMAAEEKPADAMAEDAPEGAAEPAAKAKAGIAAATSAPEPESEPVPVATAEPEEASEDTADSGDVKMLYLMRHAETEFNAQNIIQGRCDSPVTKYGLDQAHAAGRALRKRGVHFGEFWCSPSGRAKTTLETVMLELGIFGDAVHYQCDDGLLEASCGDLEGKSRAYSRSTQGGGDDYYALHGGENIAEAGVRCGKALARIMEKTDAAQTLVVGHNIAMRKFLVTVENPHHVEVSAAGNCETFVLSYRNGTFTLEDRIPIA